MGNSNDQDDAASLNSFKTCPSEPNLSSGYVVPRQVSDNYDGGRNTMPAGGGGGGSSMKKKKLTPSPSRKGNKAILVRGNSGGGRDGIHRERR